ncbi:LPS export ABC transporter periplasmic protein LptC [Trichloromonas sp.]|uniref:LPS export ABC transporter periplasmic protein LptC n=1 Tax=Trichloromonas sp. TaxID=3069249 RepID=UPI003D815AC4
MKVKITLRNVLGFAIVLMALSLAVTVLWNFRGEAPEEILQVLPGNVDLALKKIDYTETRDGVRRWNLVADSADYNVKSGTTIVQNVFMTFFDEKGVEAGTLIAKNGETQSDNKKVSVQGDVVVKSSRGYAFYAEQLDYSDATRMISTESPVRIVSSRMELTGRGLRLNVDTQAYRVSSDVKARVQGSGKQ